MEWLILLHVLSAIVGVGPTFFGHMLVRKGQTVGELKQSLKMSHLLEFFPKIGGTIAVLSGIALVIWQDYTSFADLWIYGSIILYLLIQVTVVGFVAPLGKQLGGWSASTDLPDASPLPAEQAAILRKNEKLYAVASAMGVLLFVFMIMKPLL